MLHKRHKVKPKKTLQECALELERLTKSRLTEQDKRDLMKHRPDLMNRYFK
jgi:hypothetical protein